MSSDCPTCPHLWRQIAELRAHVRWLEDHIDFLQTRLAEITGAVNGAIEFIRREGEQPTMPRARLLPAMYLRLVAIAEYAEGRSR